MKFWPHIASKIIAIAKVEAEIKNSEVNIIYNKYEGLLQNCKYKSCESINISLYNPVNTRS